MLKSKGIIITAAVAMFAVAAISGVGSGNSAEMPVQSVAGDIAQTSDDTENQAYREKRAAFEKLLAEKKAEFERKYNEAKRRSDEMRKEIDRGRARRNSTSAEPSFLSPIFQEWLCISMYRPAEKDGQETLLGQWMILLMNGRKIPERAESWELGQSEDGRFWVTDIKQTHGTLSLTLHYQGEGAEEVAADLCGIPWMDKTMAQESGKTEWQLNDGAFVRIQIAAWEGGLDYGGVHW